MRDRPSGYEPEQSNRREFIQKYWPAVPGAIIAAAGAERLLRNKDSVAPKKPKGERESMPENLKTIEEKVEWQTNQAKETLSEVDPEKFLENGYAASALYYSDSFFRSLKLEKKANVDASRQIMANIKDSITPDVRRSFVNMLRQSYDTLASEESDGSHALPLISANYKSAGNHADALDLFAKEGSPVLSMSKGIVVLAESSWDPDDQFSASSLSGGNVVIIFDPRESKFYRYTHLGQVNVEPKQIIQPGQEIGTVGHSGTIASKAGHGNHLHFEINSYSEQDGSIKFVPAVKIEQELRGLEKSRK